MGGCAIEDSLKTFLLLQLSTEVVTFLHCTNVMKACLKKLSSWVGVVWCGGSSMKHSGNGGVKCIVSMLPLLV